MLLSARLDMNATVPDNSETAENVSRSVGSTAGAGTRDAAPIARATRGIYDNLSASSVGLEMGLAVIIGTLFGRWLDGKAGTTPWLMILFIVLGFTAGMKGIYHAMRKADIAAARADAEAAADAAAASACSTNRGAA